MPTVHGELREMLPTWAVAVLLPVPVATFWQDGSGRAFAYAYLFLGCAILTAERFGQILPVGGGSPPATGAPRLWRAKVVALGLAIAGAVCVFTAFAWAMLGRADAVVPLLAALAVVPALCCVPFLVIVTGKPYAAVLLTTFLLGSVKLAGCVVVRAVYGPTALAEGHMTLPWERPNLLVWLCLAGAMTLSAVLYPLGRRAFLTHGMPAPANQTTPYFNSGGTLP
jgi:hypothetical protein